MFRTGLLKQKPYLRAITACALATVLAVWPQPEAACQVEVIRREPLQGVSWWWYDPRFAVAARIYAQSELVRSYGSLAVDLAVARDVHARAIDKELDVWVKHVRAYWDRKLIREEKLLELRQYQELKTGHFLHEQKIRESRAWDRVKNHPQLARVATGDALNFLLTRLGSSLLSYDFVHAFDETPPEADDALALSPDQLRGIRLQQAGRGGDRAVFRADGRSSALLDWWPYLLRSEELKTEREAFELARSQVVAEGEAGGTLSMGRLQELERALAALSWAFYANCSAQQWKALPLNRRSQYLAAENFLRELDSEVVRLQNTGDADAFRIPRGFDPARDGSNLVGLLTYMCRNGVEFAPAEPGDEPVYQQVFALMRDLYLLVADNDPAIRPEPLRSPLK